MEKSRIPRKVVYRLSQYQRVLGKLVDNSVATVSSSALAKASGVKPAQLRKDLAHFGQFGTRGLGYHVDRLRGNLDEVLGTAHLQPVVLVGVGNLGAALLKYGGFAREGFEIIAAFDNDSDKCSTGAFPVTVHPVGKLKRFIKKRDVRVAILTVPGSAAQEITNGLVEADIQAILNFAPVILQVPPHVVINNVDLALELENLSYFTR